MKPEIAIHDVSKDEIIIREMNEKELKVYEADKARGEADKAVALEKIAAHEAAKASAIAKLAALGLTEAEIQALAG